MNDTTMTFIAVALIILAYIAGWYAGTRNISMYITAVLMLNGLRKLGTSVIKWDYPDDIKEEARKFLGIKDD